MRRLGPMWFTGLRMALTAKAGRRRGGGMIRAGRLARRHGRPRWGGSVALRPSLGGLGLRRSLLCGVPACGLMVRLTWPRSCRRCRLMTRSRRWRLQWRLSRWSFWRTRSPTGSGARAPAGHPRSVVSERHLFLFLVCYSRRMWVTPPRPVAHR